MTGLREVWVGDALLAFDGRVLEVFGFPGHESVRFHVRNLDLTIDEPDGRGRRLVALRPASRGSGGCQLDVAAEDWPEAEPFFDGVLAAMPD